MHTMNIKIIITIMMVISFCNITFLAFLGSHSIVKPLMPPKKILSQTFNQLEQRLTDEPMDHFLFQSISKELKLMVINKTFLERSIYVPNNSSFKRVLKKALTGQNITIVVIGGSISAGAVLEKKINRTYHSLLTNYLNYIFEPLGSTLNIENLSLGASSSRFFAFCFESYIDSNDSADIVIWESSANDAVFIKETTSKATYLELLTRRLLTHFSDTSLIVHLHLTLGGAWSMVSCKSIVGHGSSISKHYEIPMINWHMYACGEGVTQKRNLWGWDNAHPSELAHAHIAYLLIHMFRNVFRYQTDTLLQMNTRQEIDEYLKERKVVMGGKESLYVHSNGLKDDAVCFTHNIVANGREAKNKLKVKIIRNDGYSIIKAHSFKVRKDVIQGLGIIAKPNKTLHLEIEVPKKRTEGSWRLFIGTYGTKWNHAKITLDKVLQKYELSNVWGHTMTPIAYVNQGKHDLVFQSLPGNFVLTTIALN